MKKSAKYIDLIKIGLIFSIIIVLIIVFELFNISKLEKQQQINKNEVIPSNTIYYNDVDDEVLNNYDLLAKKVSEDEQVHSYDYKEFTYNVYKKQPSRIFFKLATQQGFREIKDIGDTKYDHILESIEERMHYTSFEDQMWTKFQPLSIDQILESDKNYVILNYDDSINNKKKGYDSNDYQRDIVLEINKQSPTYRLLLLNTFYNKVLTKEETRQIIKRDEFVFNNTMSGYEYMQADDKLGFLH